MNIENTSGIGPQQGVKGLAKTTPAAKKADGPVAESLGKAADQPGAGAAALVNVSQQVKDSGTVNRAGVQKLLDAINKSSLFEDIKVNIADGDENLAAQIFADIDAIDERPSPETARAAEAWARDEAALNTLAA